MIRIPVRTTNPNNGATGHTQLAGILRAKDRKAQRMAARLCCTGRVHIRENGWVLPEKRSVVFAASIVVTVTRVAPSNGLDPHDGLGAALKGCIDGIADALGLKNDRDPRVTWVLAQRRGAKAEYAVEVSIEAR